MVLRKMYHDREDGLCGNDDAGQMSAWYIFSAIGFYPVLPGSNEYAIGSPLVKSAIIDLGNGKKLIIETKNQSDRNIYVKKITVNGKIIKNHILNYEEIKNGGKILFEMCNLH